MGGIVENEKKPDLEEKGISTVGAYYLAHDNIYGDIVPYNPDDLLINKGYDIYDKMMLDDSVKSAMALKKGAILSRSYYFDHKKDEKQRLISDFFSYVLDNIEGNFFDALSGIMTALEHGYSVTEKNYMAIQWENKAYWGIKSFKTRPFETFDNGIIADKHGNIKYFKQFTQTGEEVILEKDKVIHCVNNPNISNLYGQSDLKSCYREYWHKDITIKFQSIHLERSAGGFLYAKVSAPLSSAEDAALKELITNVSAATGAALPDSISLEAFQPLKTDAYEKAISQYNKAIARSLLVPNLIGVAEQSNTGSYAQAEVQLKAFFWTLLSISTSLEEILNEQLFRQLAAWNFATDIFPKFKFEALTQQEKLEYIKIWGELTQKRVVKNMVEDEQFIRRILKFTELTEEEIKERKKEPVITQDPQEGAKPVQNYKYVEMSNKSIMLNKNINYSKIEKDLDTLEQPYIKGLTEAMAVVRDDLTKQIGKMFKGNKGVNTSDIPPARVLNIKVKDANVKKIIAVSVRKALDAGSKTASNSMPDKKTLDKERRKLESGKTLFSDAFSSTLDMSQAEKFLRVKNYVNFEKLGASLESAMHTVLLNSIKYNKSLPETMEALYVDPTVSAILPDATGAKSPYRLYAGARTSISDAFNQGRQAFFTQPELKEYVQAFQYSAVLDESTTEICSRLHGRIKKDFGSYTPVNHFSCRSILIPVTIVDKWDGKENTIPSTVKPSPGFG